MAGAPFFHFKRKQQNLQELVKMERNISR